MSLRTDLCKILPRLKGLVAIALEQHLLDIRHLEAELRTDIQVSFRVRHADVVRHLIRHDR